MRKNIALLICSLAVILIFAEFIIKMLRMGEFKKPMLNPVPAWINVPEEVWTEYDSELGWFHQKNKQVVLRKGKILAVDLATNNFGFRGTRNYERKRPAGIKRIMVLGDSFIFGWGVRDHETFSAQMELENPNLEVINLGVAGYGLDQISLSFKKIGEPFRPDFVFIGIFPEDFWRATRAFTDAGYAKPYYSISKSGGLTLHNVPVPKPQQMRIGQFPEVIKHSFVEKLLLHSALYRLARKTLLRLGRDVGILDPSIDEEWLLGRAILRKLTADIRSLQAEPVLLVIPPKEWLKNRKLTSLQKSLNRFAERERVPIIDLTPFLSKVVSETELTDYYIKDEWHWTAKGHELAATVLADYLKREKYLT